MAQLIKWRVGVSIPQGNGKSEVVEEIVEANADEDAARPELEHVLWNLLDNAGVSSWFEKVEDPGV